MASQLSAAEPAAADPAEVLARHGLTRIDRVWLLADEIRLREGLAELPKRRERILALERDLDERIEHNRKAWQAAQPAIASFRKSLGRLGSEDPLRTAVQQQVDALSSATAEPAKLGGRGEIRARVVQWNDERHGLAAAVFQFRGLIDSLGTSYERVSQTAGVAESIRQSGEKHRLGPQRSYDGDRDKLREYERLACTPWAPIFMQGSHVRVAALIDDRAPVTFTWIDSSGPGIVLTRTAADAAGLSVPANAPREVISRSPTERATARRIELASFRLGKAVLRNVPVLILPPEAEDWGCQLCREALAGYSVALEPERLRLVVSAR